MIILFNSILNLSYWQLALAYTFVLIVLVLIKSIGIGKEKELLISSIRMTVQLIIVGFILTYIFNYPNFFITSFILLLMVFFAIHTIFKKFKGKLSYKLKKVITIAFTLGVFPVIFFFIFVVIQVKPLYNPQYVIPISGMIIGNSMTGITLGLNTMVKRFTLNVEEIETSLILGATPRQASKDIINDAFDNAITPTINSMLGMGIIFLPGMMTGQILSGTIPTTSIMYQIAIMLGILGGVGIVTYLCLVLGYKTYFNSQKQLIYDSVSK